MRIITKVLVRLLMIVMFISLFSLELTNVRMLGVTEDEVAAIEVRVEFSELIIKVLKSAPFDPAQMAYLLSCKGSAAILLLKEAHKMGQPWEDIREVSLATVGGRCKPPHIDEELMTLWREISGGYINWLVEELLHQMTNLLHTDEEKVGDSHRAAARITAGFLASISRLHLRFSFAINRAFGLTSIAHGLLGGLGLVPGDVNFRALKTSRGGSFLMATMDLIDAHVEFWFGAESKACRGALRRELSKQCAYRKARMTRKVLVKMTNTRR